jgi:hypothetical protein
MPRDTHAEPIAEIAIEPYRELLAPKYFDDVYKPIEPKTLAGQRFAQAETLAELLGLALDDFEAILDDPRYVVHLTSWHAPAAHRLFKPERDERTAVCLGGAVIARSLGAPIDLWLSSDDFLGGVETRLMTLDSLRLGNVHHAHSRLHEIDEIYASAALRSAQVLNDKFEPLQCRSMMEVWRKQARFAERIFSVTGGPVSHRRGRRFQQE